MSAEHHVEHSERHEQHTAQLEAASAERLAELHASVETSPDRPDQRAEAAREVIAKHEPTPEPGSTHETGSRPAQHPLLSIKLNYAQTMTSLRSHLKPASRTFSKFIHAPVVEKTSEALEQTVARPSVVLGATWTALIVGAVFYFTARHYGYPLSGSELLFSFIVGALLGLLGEGLLRALKRR